MVGPLSESKISGAAFFIGNLAVDKYNISNKTTSGPEIEIFLEVKELDGRAAIRK
jgi:hypothetical protein